MTRIKANLVAAAFLVIQAASCPVGARPEIAAGLKAGYSFASQSTSDELAPGVTWSGRTGLALGAYVEVPLNRWLRLRAEPMYVQKGMEVDWPEDIPWDNVQKLNYLTVPLNMKAGLTTGNLRPFVFIGSSIGRLLLHETEFKEANPGRTGDMDYKDWELAMDLGAGTDILMGSTIGLTVDIRYSLGLTDIKSGLSSRSRVVLLLAGMFVRL